MLELIISLLMALGIELSEGANINVIDQQTGISYGVGSTVATSQGTTSTPPVTYVLVQDPNGEYYLVRR